jgi:hypothetical protein
MTAVDSVLPDKDRVEKAIQHRFFLRLHMFVILGGTFAAGLATTHFLFVAHVNHLAWRFGIAVCIAYAVFLGMIRIWLSYVGYCAETEQKKAKSSSDSDWFSGFNFSGGGCGSSSSLSSGSSSALEEGGGKFGGGGASGSWGENTPVAAIGKSSGSGGSSGGGGIDFGDDLGLIILVVVLALAIAVAIIYIVYAAPVILSEAAFQAGLAAGLARHAKKMTHPSWVGSVVHATILPFLVILLLAAGLGWYAHKSCPTALRLRDAMHCA